MRSNIWTIATRRRLNELAHWFRDANLKVWSLHAPMYTDKLWGQSGPQTVVNIAELTKAQRIAMVDEVKRAIEVADQIPFRYLIQHLGVAGEEFDEREVDAAFLVTRRTESIRGPARSGDSAREHAQFDFRARIAWKFFKPSRI